MARGMYIFHRGVTNKRKSDILPEEFVFVLQTSFSIDENCGISENGKSDAACCDTGNHSDRETRSKKCYAP